MKMRVKVLLAALICVTALGLAACAGSSGSADGPDTSFLTEKTWTCTGVVDSKDGQTYELHDVLNAYAMSIHFFGEDEVRVYVDTDFTIMKWSLDGDDLTFSGEGTYHLTVQDGGEKLAWEDFEGTGYSLVFEKDSD